MKLKSQHILFVLIAVIMTAMVAPSFAGKRKTVERKATVVTPIDTQKQRRYDYFFLEAVRQQCAGHYSAAFDLLSHCLSINPDAPEAYYLQALYYSVLNNDSTALSYLEKASSLAPNNTTYLERLAQFYINSQDIDKAITTYERLADRHRDRTDVLNVLITLYQQQKDYDGMLSGIQRIEQIDGNSEDITLSKVRVYELMGDSKSAFNALKNLSDEHPNDLNYKLMLGNWLMQHSRQKQAYKIFSAAQKEAPDNAYVQTSLYDYYNSVGDKAAANDLLDSILINPRTESGSKVTLMRGVIRDNETSGGDSMQVLNLFRRILAKSPQDTTMAQLRAAYVSLKKMPEDSLNDALRYVIAIQPENAAARLQLIQNYWPHQVWDTIIDLSKPGTEYNTDEMVFSYFLAIAYYQKKQTDNALEAIQQALRRVQANSDADLVSDCYSILGDIYHEKKMMKDAFAAYDSCLQWKKDNIGALNNYAYYLSVEGIDLHKAEEMSYKTIKAEPKNATYLDTYAWILFRQKRFTEARIYIDQALRSDTDSTQSSVILEHAGDIYFKNGDPDKALEYWQAAMKAGSDSAVLPRKIKEKQYIKDDE